MPHNVAPCIKIRTPTARRDCSTPGHYNHDLNLPIDATHTEKCLQCAPEAAGSSGIILAASAATADDAAANASKQGHLFVTPFDRLQIFTGCLSHAPGTGPGL
jgi:hypothetical protein